MSMITSGGSSITHEGISAYAEFLRREERAKGTMQKYIRDLKALARFLGGEALTQERAAAWKAHLLERGYAPSTINSMLAAVNGFCKFFGLPIRVKFLKVQRQLFREESRELTAGDYKKLLSAARGRIALLLETLCAIGIRVSEVKFITVEAVKAGRADVHLKGKIRTILIPKKLRRKLLAYAKAQKITAGEIFLTKAGRTLSRFQIWRDLKKLSKGAGVESSRVFPHNLRHYFATAFYKLSRDIARLADLLGHSSIETTRIYLAVSGAEQQRQLDKLGLVS